MADHLHICPLCEATCGLRLTIEDGAVTAVRGDDEDVFSGGFICPKGTAIGQLHHDPDRLRTPMVRDPGTGLLRPASWDEAFDVIRARLAAVVAEHGPDSVALFLGNPNVHNTSSAFYLPVFIKALGTTSRYTASTVDQFPKQVSSALMFGTPLSVAVPDIDRTDYLLILGANPLVSNGSMMTAPDMPGRLRALRRARRAAGRRRPRAHAHRPRRRRARGDPPGRRRLPPRRDRERAARGGAGRRRTSGHPPRGRLARLGAHRGRARSRHRPSRGSPACPPTRSAASPASWPLPRTAAVYGRMGTTTSGLATGDGRTMPLGTVASWLVDVVNVLIGSLDEPGGVMWPLPPAGSPNTQGPPGTGRGATIPGRRRTRVRGLPSILGEFPAAALAEEIDTEGPDGTRIRALITVAGNPVVSTPDSDRLERALGTLDLIISLDAYVTETSRHADVILPAPSPLARRHFDIVFTTLAISNTARYSPAAIALQPDERDEAETLMRLTAIAFAITSGQPESSVEDVDDLVAFMLAQQAVTDESSRAHGRDAADLLAAVAPRRGIERLLDLRIRSGPYGDGFGTHPDGLTLGRIEAAPHGIDLGPMQPRLPEVLRTPSGRIELAPHQVVAALADAAALLADPPAEPPPGARRPPAAAQQQLLDAQPPGARRRLERLHPARAPRRRCAARGRRRR